MQNLWNHFLLFCTPTWPGVSSREWKPRIAERTKRAKSRLHLTSRRPCWSNRTKVKKSFGNLTLFVKQNLSDIFENIAVLSRECNPRVVFVHRHGGDGVTWKPPIVQFWSVLTRYNGHYVLLLQMRLFWRHSIRFKIVTASIEYERIGYARITSNFWND